nr:protein-associating with the carboxyl-terminal domain of ezrin [Ciona intestinalis]|eukprot:XP_002127426.5 protein-associating with the carboxyl-terminal domain of ezrin [Ciona intestinalis]
MWNAAWDWYYGSNDEEIFADCKFNKAYEGYDGKKTSKGKLLIRHGTLANGDSVNVFTKVWRKNKSPCPLDLCAKLLRVLRHPNILRFVGCIPVESEIHLITELASPISTIDDLDANEICSGLYDIALALQFMHDKAKVSHNNVRFESIYVTKDGVWKLGDFEHACPFAEANEEQMKVAYKSNSIIPPEEQAQGNKLKLPHKNEHAHCRDVYAFGILLQHYADQLRFATLLTKAKVSEHIEDIIRSDYENRPTMTEVISMPILHSTYINIVNFLQSVTLKSAREKEEFFQMLLLKLKDSHIFAEVVAKRIIPLLLTPVILSDQYAVKHVIQHILCPVGETVTKRPKDGQGGVLPESTFARHVIPKIVELFQSRLIHVRMILVENFSKYVHLFEKSVLNNVVLPEILLGLSDSNNQLVQGSLRALADAVPVVGGDVIVGEEREKIFSHGVPKFDGRALNESQSLAFEVKLPPRKKLVRKQEEKKKERKLTLLELAKMRSEKHSTSEEEVQRKQREMASSIENHSKVSLDRVPHTTLPTKDITAAVERKQTLNVKENQQVVREPEVEKWASSDDEAHDEWPDFETPDKIEPPELPKEKSPWPNEDENNELLSKAEVSATSSTQNDQEQAVLSPKKTLSQTVKKTNNKLQLKKKSTDSKSKQKQSATVNNSIPKKALNTRSNHTTPTRLGEEFEITVKKTIKPPLNEMHFFAEMEPEITSLSPLSAALGGNASQKRTDVGENSEIRSVDSGRGSLITAFNAVDDTNVEDGWGWDHDSVAWE